MREWSMENANELVLGLHGSQPKTVKKPEKMSGQKVATGLYRGLGARAHDNLTRTI